MKFPIQNHKRMAVQTSVLRFLYMGGVLTTLFVAPQLARLIGSPDRSEVRRKELYKRIRQARYTLTQRGLIYEKETPKGRRFYLTPKGEQSIEKVLAREYKIPEQVHWDGKWRMLIFDIKEKRRKTRFQLRMLLRGAGFIRLQDSVWVYPFPCDEFVSLVRAHLASGVGELRSVVVEALESDRPLREHFGLTF